MQGSISDRGVRRRTHKLGTLGLRLAFTGGLLAGMATVPLIVSAQTDESTPVASTSNCRTVLQGEQTSPTLFDLSQFVPVSQLSAGTAPAATPAPTLPAATAAPASIAATPIAATPIAGGAADSATAEALRSIAFGVINCTSQGDFETLGGIVTTAYLSQTFAGGADLDRDDLLGLAAVTVVPEQQLIAFDNVTIAGDTATAEVISSSGNQLLHEAWTFINDAVGTGWVLDHATALEPLALSGSATSTATFDGNGINTDPREVTSGNIVLVGENNDAREHEMLVLRLPQGTTTEILLQQAGPELPDGVEFIGQMTVPANGSAVLPLMNLAPGNYVVVCMLLDETGTPYLANGYRARLIVV